SDIPTNSTILGAAKLSGKRASGWSIGILDALTAREWATVADTTTNLRHRDEVEPLTNYFVGRLKRDLRHGNTTLGLVATAVNRDLDTPALNMLGSAAYTGGVDFFHRWGHHTYTLAASLGGSYIQGDTLALQDGAAGAGRGRRSSTLSSKCRTGVAGTTTATRFRAKSACTRSANSATSGSPSWPRPIRGAPSMTGSREAARSRASRPPGPRLP